MVIEKEKIEEGIKMTDKKLSKRIFAYIIDSTIVLLLTTLIINIKYLNPTYDTALEKSNTRLNEQFKQGGNKNGKR